MLISGTIQLNVCLHNKLNSYLFSFREEKMPIKGRTSQKNTSMTKEEYASDRKNNSETDRKEEYVSNM